MASIEEIEERLRHVEGRERIDVSDIVNRLAKIEAGGPPEELSELKERIAELEDLQMLLELENIKLKEALSEAGAKVSLEESGALEGMTEPSAHEGHAEYSDIERRLDELESRISSAATGHKTEVPVQATDIAKEVRRLEERINAISEMGKAHVETAEMKNIEREALGKIETVERRFDTKLNASLHEVKSDLASRIEAVDRALKSFTVEPKLKDIESRLGSVQAELNRKYAGMQSTVSSIEGRIGERSSDIQKIEKTVEDVKKEMEDDVRREVGKQRVGVDFSEKMSKMSEDLRRTVERGLEGNINKFLMDRLESFAKELDKRLPRFITVDDYRKDMYFLTQKIDRITKPDLGTLISRVNDLEKRVNEVVAVVRGVSGRVPYVVE